MDTTRSELAKALVRAGLRGNGAGTPALHRNERPGAAMERAHRKLPAEGGDWRSGGMRIQNARADAPASDVVIDPGKASDPSPAHGRPVLRLVHCSSRLRPVRYATGPSLTLIVGGKR